MVNPMLDVGDPATKEIVSTKDDALWDAKPRHGPILPKAFEDGGQYKNPYHCGH
jgi:hypothetical protein